MNILIFSGTGEGRDLSKALARAGHDVTVCVLTEYGKEEQGEYEGVIVLAGKKPPEEIVKLLAGMDVCIDATHPFATHIRESIRTSCEETGVRRIRLIREESDLGGVTVYGGPDGAADPAVGDGREDQYESKVVLVDSAEEAAEYLKDREGKILLTTGAKDLLIYAAAGPERLYPRVLPFASSLDACENAKIPRKNIIAMQGPFIKDINVALMKQFGISYMVTKDSGKEGGFDDKMEASREAGATLIVIRRPDDQGVSAEEILKEFGAE